VCFSQQIFKKYSNIKFHKNPSIETDRYEEFAQLCERCYKKDTLGPTLAVVPQEFKKGVITI
jgi:hypothetical protein